MKNIIVISSILSLMTSCHDNNRLPRDIEARMFGLWVVAPSIRGKNILMYRFNNQRHDKCSFFRFDASKEFYWGYMNKKDSTNYLSCGNTLRPSYESTWTFEKNSMILDKVWSSIEERKREKLRYYVYEFSPDTFTLVLVDTLLSEHKNVFNNNDLLP